jgi:hypothetical protein
MVRPDAGTHQGDGVHPTTGDEQRMTKEEDGGGCPRDVGRILCGEEWKAPMARMLGWLNGRMPFPHDHPALLRLPGEGQHSKRPACRDHGRPVARNRGRNAGADQAPGRRDRPRVTISRHSSRSTAGVWAVNSIRRIQDDGRTSGATSWTGGVPVRPMWRSVDAVD